MTLESIPCAVCGNPVPLDTDHTRLEVEGVRMEDPTTWDEFVFHDDCWRRVSGSWVGP